MVVTHKTTGVFMASDDLIHAVHRPTGLIEFVPRGYVEEAFPHLYREATAEDLQAAQASAEAALYGTPAPAPAQTAANEEG
jgi:hypothetical protein